MAQFEGISAQQASLQSYTQQQKTFSDNLNNTLWQYTKLGTINNIPVQQQDRNLIIQDQQTLQQAMQLNPKVCVWSGLLSQQNAQNLQKYAQIKQKQIDGQIQIISEDKQFCADKSAFLVVLTYAQLTFKLSPRYQFYRQGSSNE